MFRSLNIFINLPFPSLALLFKLSYLGTIRKTAIVFASVFIDWQKTITGFTIWLAVIYVLRSFVPTWKMMCSGLKSCNVGFTRFYTFTQLTFAIEKCLTLTMYLWLILLAIKKPLTFFTIPSCSMNTISRFWPRGS